MPALFVAKTLALYEASVMITRPSFCSLHEVRKTRPQTINAMLNFFIDLFFCMTKPSLTVGLLSGAPRLSPFPEAHVFASPRAGRERPGCEPWCWKLQTPPGTRVRWRA